MHAMAVIVVLAVACSAPPRIDGPWEVGFYAADAGPTAAPLDCYIDGWRAGKIAGTWVVQEKDGKLSGQWDVCDSILAGNDLAGAFDEISGAFAMSIDHGAVGIVEGGFFGAGDEIQGLATGLGPDIVVRGKRPSTGKGKSLPPPPK